MRFLLSLRFCVSLGPDFPRGRMPFPVHFSNGFPYSHGEVFFRILRPLIPSVMKEEIIRSPACKRVQPGAFPEAAG